jgi:hypothetical protein
MATLNKDEIEAALRRLGELALAQGLSVRLLVVGGGAMVLGFGARESTRDLDVAILAPADSNAAVRAIADTVGAERGWPARWLNDAAKGFLTTISVGTSVFTSPGIEAVIPRPEQLLGMKLCAWRDDLDIADAARLLSEVHGDQNEVWRAVEPFLVPGQELKAKYAFLDLWEASHGGS